MAYKVSSSLSSEVRKGVFEGGNRARNAVFVGISVWLWQCGSLYDVGAGGVHGGAASSDFRGPRRRRFWDLEGTWCGFGWEVVIFQELEERWSSNGIV